MSTVIVPFAIVVLVVLVALFFDFMNGFHDAANSIATVVSTRVLTPRLAVLWAAFFNFVAAFLFGVNVASTIGKGTIDPSIVTAWLLLATLLGATAWDIITWWFGLPTSSSHALVGGLIGAGVVKGGWGVVQVAGLNKILLFIVLSPLIGLLAAIGLILLTARIGMHFHRSTADHVFRRLQLVSAALYSLGHGTNDAQKTMGIIAALLFAQGILGPTFYVPYYVIIIAGVAMGLGTWFGGWRIVRTMGILGSGDVGKTLGKGFVNHGHSVKLGTRTPDSEKLKVWRKEAQGETSTGTFSEAASYGDILVFAPLGSAVDDVIGLAGAKNFAGKIVIDTTNALDFSKGMPPGLFTGLADSLGEKIQRKLPQAKVVKCFNTVPNSRMISPGDKTAEMLICGNDAEAKHKVAQILKEFGWAGAIDIGGITEAKWLEALVPLWVRAAVSLNSWNAMFKVIH